MLSNLPPSRMKRRKIVSAEESVQVIRDDGTIAPEILYEQIDMVKRLVDRFYTSVTRYTTSTFLRMKLGDALEKRNISPHIYESKAESQQALGISLKVENA